MKRAIFTLAAAVSLLLCALVAATWVHSLFTRAVWGYTSMPNDGVSSGCEIGTAPGRIIFATLRYIPSDNPPRTGLHGVIYRAEPPAWNWWPQATPSGYGAVGITWEHRIIPADGREAYVLIVPDVFLIVLFLILPIVWWRRRGVVLPGHCQACGYDLRATPNGCPECGAASAMAVS